jgi:hypothetical protein
MFGGGMGVSELALSEEPVTAERAFKVLGGNAAFGGLLGGGIGGGGALLGEAARAGKAALAERAAAREAKAVASGGTVADDLANLERPELVKLRQAERERLNLEAQQGRKSLQAEREAERAKLADDHVSTRARLKAEREAELAEIGKARATEGGQIAASVKAEGRAGKDWYNAIDDAQHRKVITGASNNVRRLGNDLESLAERPQQALGAYRQRAQALREFLAAEEAALAKFQGEGSAILKALPDAPVEPLVLSGAEAKAYRAWSGKPLAKGKITLEPGHVAEFRTAIEAGELSAARLKGVEAAKAQLAADDAMITRIKAHQAPMASPKLAQIDEALAAPKATTSQRLTELEDALSTPASRTSKRLEDLETALDTYADRNGKTIAGNMTQAGATSAAGALLSPLGPMAYPLAAFLGEKAAQIFSGKMGQLLGRMKGAAADSQVTVAKALDTFAKVGKRASVAAPLITSKALRESRYAPPDVVAAAMASRRPQAPSKDADVRAYRERENELRAMTTRDQTGRLVVNQTGQQVIAESLTPIKLIMPKLADVLAQHAETRLSFLASKLPERPGTEAMPLGPDTWQPSDHERRKFARYADAVEGGPERILERLNGGKITPEDAEVLREVYPETYREIQVGLIERLATIRESMPYAKRLNLGILFDTSTDPTLQPHVIAALQGSFAREEGSEGGTQSPAPRLASISKPAPTQAQKLSE